MTTVVMGTESFSQCSCGHEVGWEALVEAGCLEYSSRQQRIVVMGQGRKRWVIARGILVLAVPAGIVLASEVEAGTLVDFVARLCGNKHGCFDEYGPSAFRKKLFFPDRFGPRWPYSSCQAGNDNRQQERKAARGSQGVWREPVFHSIPNAACQQR